MVGSAAARMSSRPWRWGLDFVFVGRPFLFAAAAAGPEGVEHALQLLRMEIARGAWPCSGSTGWTPWARISCGRLDRRFGPAGRRA